MPCSPYIHFSFDPFMSIQIACRAFKTVYLHVLSNPECKQCAWTLYVADCTHKNSSDRKYSPADDLAHNSAKLINPGVICIQFLTVNRSPEFLCYQKLFWVTMSVWLFVGINRPWARCDRPENWNKHKYVFKICALHQSFRNMLCFAYCTKSNNHSIW